MYVPGNTLPTECVLDEYGIGVICRPYRVYVCEESIDNRRIVVLLYCALECFATCVRCFSARVQVRLWRPRRRASRTPPRRHRLRRTPLSSRSARCAKERGRTVFLGVGGDCFRWLVSSLAMRAW